MRKGFLDIRRDPQVATSPTQQGLDLRVPFKAFCHSGHLIGDAPCARLISAPFEHLVPIAELSPGFHEMIRAKLRIGPVPAFPFHRADGVPGIPRCGLPEHLHVADERGAKVASSVWSHRIERATRCVKLGALRGQLFQSTFAHSDDFRGGFGEAYDCLMQGGPRRGDRRPRSVSKRRAFEPVDLSRRPGRCWKNDRAAIGEVVAPIMQVDTVAMAGEPDISGVPVQTRRRAA